MRNQFILLLFFMSFHLSVRAQDTAFYSRPYIEAADLNSCQYYEISHKDKSDPSKKSVTAYYKSGQLKTTYTLQKGKETGKTTEYYENGNIHYEIAFEDEQVKSIYSYWRLGQPKRKEQFKDGKRIMGQCFNLIGKEIEFFKFDKEAEFPGGEDGLSRFLSDHIIYPAEAQAKNIQGKVIVSFVINEEGGIEQIKVITSVNPDLANEALRVIRLMPRWKPAMQDGNACNTSFTLPVIFTL